DGEPLPIEELIDGAPSVLFDAVAIVLTEAGAAMLGALPVAKDWVSDAHAHCKLVGCGPGADLLLAAAGIGAEVRDAGYVDLDPAGKGATRASAEAFVTACRQLRYWERLP